MTISLYTLDIMQTICNAYDKQLTKIASLLAWHIA